MTQPKTYLDLVKECNNFPYKTDNPSLYKSYLKSYYAFKVAGYTDVLGHVPNYIIRAFTFPDGWVVDHDRQELILAPGLDGNLTGSEKVQQRTALMDSTLKAMSTTPTRPEFLSLARKWRNETFPIYTTTSTKPKTLLLEIERSASALFGILTSGVQLTAYTTDPVTNELKIWVARRSRKKQTYAGMLDSAAAGGLETGMCPLEGVVREAVEEASLGEGVVRNGVKCVGALSYYHVMPPSPSLSSETADANGKGEEEVGFLQPEIEYIYELHLDSDTRPEPGDSEVEEFYLWSVEEVKAALLRGEFKLNSAIVVIDFFVRHGVITAENERDYVEIVCRLHRRL
ncbi:NUDIX hydrolase domain-like protein [Aspergillus germanicus]